ncbi:hypothetical protein GCM10027569_86700 [Flindersiella endophytica]
MLGERRSVRNDAGNRKHGDLGIHSGDQADHTDGAGGKQGEACHYRGEAALPR